jgi:protein-S-isoprenylcysteine O-methyltransferase Ste14
MRRGVIPVVAATVAFACVHSALASLAAKRVARRLVGERRYRALYRPFYIAQSVVTFAALARYIYRQPDVVLYRLRGPAAAAAVTGQIGALAYGVWAARRVGIGRPVGAAGLRAFAAGSPSIPPHQEAQGPAPAGTAMDADGPFAHARHPLNLAPVPLFWLSPVMTANLAAFSSVATLYLVVGSAHEEHRLSAAYGEAYRRYQRSGVPFYVPRPRLARSGVTLIPPARAASAAGDKAAP